MRSQLSLRPGVSGLGCERCVWWGRSCAPLRAQRRGGFDVIVVRQGGGWRAGVVAGVPGVVVYSKACRRHEFDEPGALGAVDGRMELSARLLAPALRGAGRAGLFERIRKDVAALLP